MGEFGQKFRSAREAKKLSFDDVSKVIKISARMLKAIEDEQFDHLPGGVFNRGFIRAYSKHLGLNDEEAVNEYLACLQQAQVEASQILEPGPSARPAAPNKLRVVETRKVEAQKSGDRTSVQVEELPDLQLPRAEHIRSHRRRELSDSREFPWALAAAAIVLIVLGIVLWIRHSRSKPAISPSPTAAPQTPSQSVTVPASSQASTTKGPNSTPASSSPPAKVSTARPHTAPRSSALESPTPAAETAHTNVNAGVTPGSSTAAPAAKPLTLVIRATETSWISISADGQPVAQETLIAPAQTTIRASNEITVRVGNAAGVNFVFNGKELPAQGAESEAKTFVFDAQGMRAPATQP